MTDLCRIGVAISGDLLEKFDKLIAQRGYTNRSEAFRDLIRNELVQETWKSSDSEVFGTVTLVYDHHARLLPERLTELQHHYHAAVLSALHVHLDHDNCLEVVLVKGKAALVEKLSNALIAIKGVKHGRFTVTTSGHDLPCDGVCHARVARRSHSCYAAWSGDRCTFRMATSVPRRAPAWPPPPRHSGTSP
jgi:CopG family nickel-responsive transcriptional regulator